MDIKGDRLQTILAKASWQSLWTASSISRTPVWRTPVKQKKASIEKCFDFSPFMLPMIFAMPYFSCMIWPQFPLRQTPIGIKARRPLFKLGSRGGPKCGSNTGGNLYLACSGKDKVAIVQVSKERKS
jgi:hypothetical protein